MRVYLFQVDPDLTLHLTTVNMWKRDKCCETCCRPSSVSPWSWCGKRAWTAPHSNGAELQKVVPSCTSVLSNSRDLTLCHQPSKHFQTGLWEEVSSQVQTLPARDSRQCSVGEEAGYQWELAGRLQAPGIVLESQHFLEVQGDADEVVDAEHSLAVDAVAALLALVEHLVVLGAVADHVTA